MDTIKIVPQSSTEHNNELEELKNMLIKQSKELERMNKYKDKQKETWKRNAKIYYNKHYAKGGDLDDATVEANIEKRKAYYRDYHDKRRVVKIPPTPAEVKTEEELRIIHKKKKRKEYNERAYLKRVSAERQQ